MAEEKSLNLMKDSIASCLFVDNVMSVKVWKANIFNYSFAKKLDNFKKRLDINNKLEKFF